MAWRLLHALFGWDFILIPYGFGSYACRVRTDANGRPYVVCHGAAFFIKGGLALPVASDSYARSVIPLTAGAAGL